MPKLGRRGTAQHLLAYVYFAFGLGFVVAPDLPPTSRQALSLALSIAPIQVWGVAWMVTGAVAWVAAFWPVGHDGYGFGALAAAAIGWSCVYATGAVVYDAPRAWASTMSWVAVAALILLMAGWPECPGKDDDGG